MFKTTSRQPSRDQTDFKLKITCLKNNHFFQSFSGARKLNSKIIVHSLFTNAKKYKTKKFLQQTNEGYSIKQTFEKFKNNLSVKIIVLKFRLKKLNYKKEKGKFFATPTLTAKIILF